jgi:hypothetical protein
MSQASFPNVAGGGLIQAAAQATPNTAVLRDTLGGGTFEELICDGIWNTGMTLVGQLAVTASGTDSGVPATAYSTILCNAQSNAITRTLPLSSGVPGMRIKYVKTDASSYQVMTVAGAGDTINGTSTGTVLSSKYAYASYEATQSLGWIAS